MLHIRLAEDLHYLSTSRWERRRRRQKSDERAERDLAAMEQNQRDDEARQLRREELTRVPPTMTVNAAIERGNPTSDL